MLLLDRDRTYSLQWVAEGVSITRAPIITARDTQHSESAWLTRVGSLHWSDEKDHPRGSVYARHRAHIEIQYKLIIPHLIFFIRRTISTSDCI